MSALSDDALNDLRHMLSDKDFASIFLDGEEISKYKFINADGSVTLGKTKYKLINKLFNGEKTLSVNDVCLRLIDIITGKSGARNKDAFDSLVVEFSKALNKKDYSEAITRIFVGYRLAFKEDINVDENKSDTDIEYKDGKKKYMCVDGVAVRDGFNNVFLLDFKRRK